MPKAIQLRLEQLLEDHRNNQKQKEINNSSIVLSKAIYTYFREANTEEKNQTPHQEITGKEFKIKKMSSTRLDTQSNYQSKNMIDIQDNKVKIENTSNEYGENLKIFSLKNKQVFGIKPKNIFMHSSQRQLPISYRHLYSSSSFEGLQSNNHKSYSVSVSLKYVDLSKGVIDGHFSIFGLTEEYSELKTFFQADIIGLNNNSFITNKWGANLETDIEHWSKFREFEDYNDVFYNAEQKFQFNKSENIFMRWKELFLLPDHKTDNVRGASFAGFYYMCYNPQEHRIYGFYYHRDSEKFQTVDLMYTNDSSFTFFELS
ncbi:hypothetical protein BB561_001657 [Smittium simulii]|uniref:Vacuolar import and degradation protein n=1 Tax=Smittium simulii TaxID=133385 RepID=A0A2T9YTN7_9FUNG|nr:hypothetical protein BB561_001657 [Smittium simulii]